MTMECRCDLVCVWDWSLYLISGSRASCEGSFRPYISNVLRARNIIFWFCLDQIDFIGFPRGIILSIGFALSADCQEIVGLLCGLAASNQRVLFIGFLSQQPRYRSYNYFIIIVAIVFIACCSYRNTKVNIQLTSITHVSFSNFVNRNKAPTVCLETWSETFRRKY